MTPERPVCARCGHKCPRPWTGTRDEPRLDPPDPWLARLDTLTRACTARWPQHTADLQHVRDLAAQLTHDWHLADPVTHDGIRSPNLEPSGHSIGGHSDPTLTIVLGLEPGWDAERAREAARSGVMRCLVTLSRQNDEHRARRNVQGAIDNLRTALGRTHLRMPSPGALAKMDGPPDRVPCLSCKRVTNHKGEPLYVDASHKAGGRNGLCQWCDGYKEAHHRLPPVRTLERKHLNGETITVAKVERDLADERAAERKRNQRKRSGRKAS